MSNKKIYQLSQVCTSIENFFAKHLGNQRFWIQAEISNFKINSTSGHAYLDLVEEKEGIKISVISATIWSEAIDQIRDDLGLDFDHIMKDGSEIVFSASVRYHKVFGLSLSIFEIDSSFNIGELEKRKQANIQQLQEEGIIHSNKELNLPMIIQKIAIIGAHGTAGFYDFIKHLEHNQHGYQVSYDVFQSSVQGINAPSELINAFKKASQSDYDAIVFIRGGGSKLDLDAYNHLELCRIVATSSIPILSGIGHEIDISIIDIVSHSSFKTPTAVAGFIINRMQYYESALYNNYILIAQTAQARISHNKEMLEGIIQSLYRDPISTCKLKRADLHNLSNQVIRIVNQEIAISHEELGAKSQELFSLSDTLLKVQKPNELLLIKKQIAQLVLGKLSLEKSKINNWSDMLNLIEPNKTLSRGFSIVRKNGKEVSNTEELSLSDELSIQFNNGQITAIIKNIKS